MNNTEKLVEKCQSILAVFEKYNDTSDIVQDKKSSTIIPELELEFKHIVYDYDSNLPLNENLRKVYFEMGCFPNLNHIINFKIYIKFFINYLNNKEKDFSDAIVAGIDRANKEK